MAWSLACPDWQERIRTGRSLIPDLPLAKPEAARAIAIWNRLRLPDVEEKPALAEAGGEWFREIVGVLFGSFDAATRERMIRELFLLVPKKSSKTTNGAALMLTALLLNARPRAEFLLIGPTKMVSDLAFSQAVGMIEADPEQFLAKRMHVQEHLKKITDRRTRASLIIKTFDTSVVTGVKPAGVLIDELHEISSDHNADRVIGQLRGGLLPNPEAFLIFITTQSERPPAGVFRSELAKARGVRDGLVTDVPMLPVLYEFPPDIARVPEPGETPPWHDASLWWMVTPNRDRSITINRLKSDFAGARSDGVGEVARWASQHLNIEIGLALHSDRWRGVDHWAGASEPALTFDALVTRSEVICIGVDGGGLDDLLGLAVLGREIGTRRWLLWNRAWAHRSVLELRKAEAPRLRDLEASGELSLVDDMDLAFGELADVVAAVDASGLLAMVGLDPMGVGAIVDALAERGIEGKDRVVGVSQGWTLNGAIKTAEVKLANRTLVHCGQALMAWAVSNARVEPRGNAVTITKQAAGAGKIDPLMASLDAVALMSRNPDSMGTSFYETMTDAQAVELGLQSAAESQQIPAQPAPDDAIDQQILADPSHPRWEELKRRYEDALASADEEDEY